MNSMKRKLLLVDDDRAVLEFLSEVLGDEGYSVRCVSSGEAALDALNLERFELVISDVEMPEMRGEELLSAIHQRWPSQLVLLITAFGSIERAVRAVKNGACDFVTKPFTVEVLVHAIERAVCERQMHREIVRLREETVRPPLTDIVAVSQKMRAAVDLALRAAKVPSSVLITGESGSGKGALARLIHRSGDRPGPFLQVNCGAIPANLVESELFGVRRGAFTDAVQDRKGVFVEAHRGTLFLDEVTEMPIESQPKLLQVLESNRVRPVGASQEVSVDVRIIAATNRVVETEVGDRRFRDDLYYRLNVIRIDVPPLRDRPEDIDSLVDQFIVEANKRMGKDVMGVSAEAARWLRQQAWPGNVRELSNTIERAVALTDHDSLVLEDLCTSVNLAPDENLLGGATSQHLPLEELEQIYIKRVLESVGGNKAKAARILRIDRRTLYRKLETQV